MRPVIAIVGSVDPDRRVELGLERVELGPAACEALGRALAERGCDIVVYSSDPRFAEAAVVRGYVESGNAGEGSVQVRYPERGKGTFPEIETHRHVFNIRPDVGRDWEVSFYRSLFETDGVLLIGGGQSTLVAGLIAVSIKQPVVAVAAFGGRARDVREALARTGNDATEAHLNVMGRSWHPEAASELVGAMLEQRERRLATAAEARRTEARRSRRKAVSICFGAVLLIAALAAIPVVHSAEPGATESLIALFGGPMLAGVAGAIMRNALDDGTDWLPTAILGLGAGVIAALLFVASQLATSPDALEETGVRTLVVFVLAIGFTAGLTFDVVYTKIRQQDVLDTKALERQ